jgi:hypothetical protein
MKTFKFILSILVIGSVLFSLESCKSEEPIVGESVSATLNGSSVSIKSYSAGVYNDVTFVMLIETTSGDQIVVRTDLYEGFETQLPYQFYYDDETDAVAYTPNGETAYTTNQFDASNLYPGEMNLNLFDKAGKKISGTLSAEVKRLIDNKTATITIDFTKVPFETELPPTPNKTMTATVNGSSWSATNVTSLKSFGFISTVGNGPNSTTIGITIPDDATVGTHTISMFGDYKAQYNPSATTWMNPDDGTITITEFDDISEVIKGTFSFEAEKDGTSVTITNGSFVTSY